MRFWEKIEVTAKFIAIKRLHASMPEPHVVVHLFPDNAKHHFFVVPHQSDMSCLFSELDQAINHATRVGTPVHLVPQCHHGVPGRRINGVEQAIQCEFTAVDVANGDQTCTHSAPCSSFWGWGVCLVRSRILVLRQTVRPVLIEFLQDLKMQNHLGVHEQTFSVTIERLFSPEHETYPASKLKVCADWMKMSVWWAANADSIKSTVIG